MSFQAYLDNIEAKTGRTPNEFVATHGVHRDERTTLRLDGKRS